MPGASAWITLAAILPPLLFAAPIALLERRRRRPWMPLIAAFSWGVGVAGLAAAPLNDLVVARWSTAAGPLDGPRLAATVGAPIVEESLKVLGVALLFLLRPALRTVRDGIALGALSGLGFDLVENLQYLVLAAVQGGVGGLVRGVWVRGLLGGLEHAVFTATGGAGLGWAWERGGGPARALVPLLALAAAVIQHAVWNAVASRAITAALCGAAAPDGPCRTAPAPVALLVSIPLIVLACVGPGLLGVLLAWRGGARAQPSALGPASSGAVSRKP